MSLILPLFKKEENKDCCCYCGEDFVSAYIKIKKKRQKEKHPPITEDHLVPISKGGINRIYNRLNCCYRCNQEKKDYTIIEYLSSLLSNKHQYKDEFKEDFELKICNCLILKKYIDTSGYKLYRNRIFKKKYKKYLTPEIFYNQYLIDNIFFKILYKEELKYFNNLCKLHINRRVAQLVRATGCENLGISFNTYNT